MNDIKQFILTILNSINIEWNYHKSLLLINKIIDALILEYRSSERLLPIADIIEQEKSNIIKSIKKIINNNISINEQYDEIRSYIFKYAICHFPANFDEKQFIVGKHKVSVRYILEDHFGAKPVSDNMKEEDINFEYEKEVFEMIISCVDLKKTEDQIDFFNFFIFEGKTEWRPKTSRYTAMLWFSYLIFEILKYDLKACNESSNYIIKRLKELLNDSINGNILNSDNDGIITDKDGGIWNDSLFAFLSGCKRKEVTKKILKKFNFGHIERSNRALLAQHRDCLIKLAKKKLCQKIQKKEYENE